MSKKTKRTPVAQKDNAVLRVAAGLLLFILAGYLIWVIRQGNGIHPDNLVARLGFIGAFLYRIVHSLMGSGGFLAPCLLVVLGTHIGIPRVQITRRAGLSLVGIVLLILAWKHLGVDLANSISLGRTGVGGGLIGALCSYFFIKAFGATGTKLIFTALILVLIYIATNGDVVQWLRHGAARIQPFIERFIAQLKSFVFVDGKSGSVKTSTPRTKTEQATTDEKPSLKERISQNLPKRSASPAPVQPETPQVLINNLKEYQQELIEEDRRSKVQEYVDSGKAEASVKSIERKTDLYQLPSADLLKAIEKGSLHFDQKEIDRTAGVLQQTLADFGVQGKINEVSVGPTITEYEFQPAPGIKVSKILNLADDIALNLATSGIRMQAPIPGKAAVGIEVPNAQPRTVHFKEVIASNVFEESSSVLTVALGKDISGHPIVTDLSKMPHLLIAGSTGSGKSVCLNALILSILYKAKPYEVKFLMIDPKMVELGNYNGIPHLIAPVVTESRKASGTLQWAVKEMERRYDLFANNGVRDINSFNEKCLEMEALNESPQLEQLPKIVIIIDELADLMMVAPAEVEDSICRLAQMARAAGMHLVIATQRPSVDVITGIIKTNIPSRIAFSVSSQVDSRTILDMGGAEKLLGKGDMLFYPTGMAKPKRIQGVFVTDGEINRVVAKVKNQAKPVFNEDVIAAVEAAAETAEKKVDGEGMDALLPDACRLFIDNGSASISMLQRHFRIGYTRATRIIDELESMGYVGPYEGSKPRQIRISRDELDRVFGGSQES